jgi:hypothetical protein
MNPSPSADPSELLPPEAMLALLRAMIVRCSRQLDVDKIIDQKTPADRCCLVATLLVDMSGDAVVAQSIRDTQLLAALKLELLRRRAAHAETAA